MWSPNISMIKFYIKKNTTVISNRLAFAYLIFRAVCKVVFLISGIKQISPLGEGSIKNTCKN